ncbi:MAG TPA: hypothetical protein ENI08_02240 [Candidatus Dependentiae bacterium]|nr:hypothetical protein [Candidatus Dependentiae bacterium]
MALKQLVRRKKELNLQLNSILTDKQQLESREKGIRVKLNELDKKVEFANKEPSLSEHAILRYLERVEGIDIEKLRSEIMTTKVIEMIKMLGTGTIPSGKYKLRVIDNVVVTIINI